MRGSRPAACSSGHPVTSGTTCRRTRDRGRLKEDAAGRAVADIGRAAGVVVKGAKTATAHDLRRSFCFRWAQRVLPQHLRVPARHRGIDPTLKYDAEADAGLTADAVATAVAAVAGWG